ncbi:hypothetical protein F2Q68_00023829 [Brassica cretica]|uniref:F-box domain-containing protein n=1 Tax=Brassica cretica TaxID=69181 RepID=A0A8S9IAK6_BRACR|nr:hypothetical protein F2Q68_00023829 [Brassica cretica]
MSSSCSCSSRDRISDLPDEILGKILPLVPTKVAASTSVLSKRWKNNNLLVLVDKLSFDESMVVYPNEEEAESGSDRFLDFVDKTAMEEEQGGLLEEVHLECTRNEVNLKRKLLTSNTLVKLTLSREYCLEVERVFLPTLKSLSFLSVGGLDYNNYRRLFKGCPVLEELLITDIGADAFDPYPPCCTAYVKSASIKRLLVFVNILFKSYMI